VSDHRLLLLSRPGTPAIIVLSHQFQANPHIRHLERRFRWPRGNPR
jgi:hypothetical protein